MTELKKKFGKEIVFFVEFLAGMEDDFQYLADQDNNENMSSTTPEQNQTREAMSWDAISIDGQTQYGTLGYFGFKNATYFATTCYHVCYHSDSLPTDDDKKFDIYSTDSENKESITRVSTFNYRSLKKQEKKENEIEDNGNGEEQKNDANITEEMSGQDGESLLGSFLWGKFNKYHDIALVKVNDGQDHQSSSDICSWTTEVFPAKKVNKMIRKKGVTVYVEKIGFTSGKTGGIITQMGCCIRKKGGKHHHRKGYLIENHPYRPFAKKGDSGSLVKVLKSTDEKIPFGYYVGNTFTRKKRSQTEKCEQFYCLSLRNSLDEFGKEYTH